MTLADAADRRQEVKFPPGMAYIDGRFCPIAEATISVLDWGFLLRSDATYDVVHVWIGPVSFSTTISTAS